MLYPEMENACCHAVLVRRFQEYLSSKRTISALDNDSNLNSTMYKICHVACVDECNKYLVVRKEEPIQKMQWVEKTAITALNEQNPSEEVIHTS